MIIRLQGNSISEDPPKTLLSHSRLPPNTSLLSIDSLIAFSAAASSWPLPTASIRNLPLIISTISRPHSLTQEEHALAM